MILFIHIVYECVCVRFVLIIYFPSNCQSYLFRVLLSLSFVNGSFFFWLKTPLLTRIVSTISITGRYIIVKSTMWCFYVPFFCNYCERERISNTIKYIVMGLLMLFWWWSNHVQFIKVIYFIDSKHQNNKRLHRDAIYSLENI